MKPLVLLIIVLCLFLLYRIAFAGQPKKRQTDETPPHPKQTDEYDAVGKSRFILPDRSKPEQTATTQEETGLETKKADIFAAGNAKPDMVIPAEKLDEVFGKTTGTEQEEEVDETDLDIPPDEDEDEVTEPEPDAEEESEDLRQTPGRDEELANGLSIEEMTEAVRAVNNPSDEKAGLLCKVEPTDMFEQMVSGDDEKAARIRAIIERNVQRLNPETERENGESESGSDWENFNMADFLS
jgi:hypothetical protein